jgi:pimeloyl-ACP methyl ester carboxylesterase
MMTILRDVIHRLTRRSLSPTLRRLREEPGGRTAIIFLHGFLGSGEGTWGRFPEFVLAEKSLRSWNVYALEFATSLRVDVPNMWSADPGLTTLSLSIQSALGLPPLNHYSSIALVAHSMGGLVAQHALLNPQVAKRIGHVVLFGTPSGGIDKAILFSSLKRQVDDMRPNSRFIVDLRNQWTEAYGSHMLFTLRAVAGERDEFVPASSSLSPFPDESQRVVPGNHVQIVKPDSSSDRSVQILIQTLCGDTRIAPVVDSALIAIEKREFAVAIQTLLPNATALDENALIQLAFALESDHRSEEAVALLEARFRESQRPSTDAQGVLAGRFKRRWLVERRMSDWSRARELYASALEASAAGVGQEPWPLLDNVTDPDQAIYHAVNIAFLDLMMLPESSPISQEVREMADAVLMLATRAADNHWRAAAEGEAYLILGDTDNALRKYSIARTVAVRPRDIDSMYGQAVRVAHRIGGSKLVNEIERVFRLTPDAS